MVSLVTPANGDTATAELIAQLTEDFSGLRNIPILLTGINDASAYALTLKNAGAGSRGEIIYASDGTTVLFQVDGAGVRASRAGAAAERVLTTGESGTITPAMLAATAFTTWSTPAFTQGGTNPTATIQGATYLQLGKLVIVMVTMTVTSAGVAGDIIVSTLPVAPKVTGAYTTIGSFSYLRTAVAVYVGSVVAVSSSNIKFYANSGTGGAYLGNTNGPSFAMANGDSLSFFLVYEAA